jgi:hypothetical protein
MRLRNRGLEVGVDIGVGDFCEALCEGGHSAAPLAEGDERRIVPNTVALTAGPNLQREIDALPADVVTLTINGALGGYDSNAVYQLSKVGD